MSKAKSGKRELKPNLRFPEFLAEPPWTDVPLGESAAIITEKAGDRACVPMSITSGVGLVSQEEKFGQTIAGKSYKNYFVIQRDDFAYNKSATKEYPQGFIAVYEGDKAGAVPNSIFTCFRVDAEQINVRFLNYLFVGNHHGSWLRKYITVGGRAHGSLSIDDKDLLAMPIPRPVGESTLDEQQKIADCLISLDELIAAHSRKLGALKAHKKGLMQQLFPREGETLPRLRFPEFKDAPEWKMAELDPLTTKVGSGITPRGGSSNYKTEGRAFVRSQNVGWGVLILDDIVFIEDETHNSFIATEIEEQDVLLNITGASIGRSAIADSRIVAGNVNQHVCIIRTVASELNPVYLSQFLISQEGQEQIDSFQAGGNRQGLNFGQIRSFQIPLPPTETEQTRIAECLSSVDELISIQGEKVGSLSEHKKGLMQQLFPSLEANA